MHVFFELLVTLANYIYKIVLISGPIFILFVVATIIISLIASTLEEWKNNKKKKISVISLVVDCTIMIPMIISFLMFFYALVYILQYIC